jgi:NAD(P)-dependent dehydrogenase (short-subunit alcohol dehydrogenase family)
MMEEKTSVAFITGAGQGIGRGIALELAKKGYCIAGNDIVYTPDNTLKGLFEVKKTVESLENTFLPVRGDISSLDDHGKMLEGILREFGGAFFLTQKVANQMIEQVKKGRTGRHCIIFISSISAAVSSPSRAEYCISKAALSQVSRVFADRLAEYGIGVYEIRPGIIKTDMTAPVQEKYERLIKNGLVPQKRWGYPEDVGKAVAAVAEGYFDYSTGLVIEVSGGMNIQRL